MFGKLKADFSKIPHNQLDIEKDSYGRQFYKIYFQVEMTLRSASLTFALNYKGEKYQTTEMEFV